ncbi:hypothetical protein GCM10027073_03830 [Streptomyces chlorus]
MPSSTSRAQWATIRAHTSSGAVVDGEGDGGGDDRDGAGVPVCPDGPHPAARRTVTRVAGRAAGNAVVKTVGRGAGSGIVVRRGRPGPRAAGRMAPPRSMLER